MSIDKSGRVRTLTITEPREFRYDMDGNIHCNCAAKPRSVDVVDRPNSRPTFAAGHVNAAPPKAPGPVIGAAAAAAKDRDLGGPSRSI